MDHAVVFDCSVGWRVEDVGLESGCIEGDISFVVGSVP